MKGTACKIVPYHDKDVYSIVSDVACYQEFFPWCTKSVVYHRKSSDFYAKLWGPLGYSFVSKVILKYPIIEVQYVEGPFTYLYQSWKLLKQTGGTKIIFFIKVQFKNIIFNAMAKGQFLNLISCVIEAFEQRFYEKLHPIS